MTPTDTIPVWLLDVDGVVNALGFGVGGDDELTIFEAMGYPIAFNPAVWARALALHTEGKVEIRWLTTWCENANTYISPALGWPELEVVGAVDNFAREWWKFRYVRRIHTYGPIIWTDDDLAHDRRALAWVRDHGDTVLGISPNYQMGLTMQNLDEIEAWIEARP